MNKTLYVCGFHQAEGGDMEIVPCCIVSTVEAAESWLQAQLQGDYPELDYDYEPIKYIG